MAASSARVLYLNAQGRVDPWEELGVAPPAGCRVEGLPLTKCHADQGNSAVPTRLVLLDLDVVSRTQPLDAWACVAWRNTFNELVMQLSHKDAGPPLLLAYTRNPSWELGLLALRLGARDAERLSRLPARVEELLNSGADAKKESAAPVRSLPVPPPSPAKLSVSELIADAGTTIPRHAIPFPIEGLEGSSAAVEALRSLIRKSAPLETPVLLTGPTGSGKELVARSLHRYSPRAQGPLITVNCGAIAPGLVEAELFGHAKGAFTGAQHERIGLLQAAHGGTLFLDEIAELSLDVQVKLLRALQERKVVPVGSQREVPIDIRVVSASNSRLEERVRNGRFREDLMYRLRVMEIVLPSLAERRADLPEIAESLLKRIARRNKRKAPTVSEAVMEKLLLYAWPGNVRELENVLEHASTLAWGEARQELGLQDLPENVRFSTLATPHAGGLREMVERFEREYVAATVRRMGGDKQSAADTLGISLATLYRKIGS